jgi:hypothetical protein
MWGLVCEVGENFSCVMPGRFENTVASDVMLGASCGGSAAWFADAPEVLPVTALLRLTFEVQCQFCGAGGHPGRADRLRSHALRAPVSELTSVTSRFLKITGASPLVVAARRLRWSMPKSGFCPKPRPVV